MQKDLDRLFIEPGNKKGDDSDSVATLVKQWADREIIGKRLDYLEQYDVLFLDKLKILSLDLGLQRLAVTEDLGGFGWNSPSKAWGLVKVLLETARADASAGTMLAMHYVMACAFSGKPSEDKPDLINSINQLLLSDAVTKTAFILPAAGIAGQDTPLFNGRSILVKATADKDNVTLKGTNLRPFGPGKTADLFCVVCADDKGTPAVAVVPGNAKGIKRGAPIISTGLNACINADITLDEVRIPVSHFITGIETANSIFIWINLLSGAVSLGAALNFFEILSDWSEARVIKGFTMLKENPLCASVLADVAEELACAKLLLLDLATLISDSGMTGSQDAARLYTYGVMIGSRVQQGVMKAINRGLELMGSAGYAREWHVEKHWRDVKTIQAYLCGVAAEAPVRMDTARFFYSCKEI